MAETPLSFRKLQHEAKERSVQFLDAAGNPETAREAADWALAAKNAISVAVSCETLLKIRNGEEGRDPFALGFLHAWYYASLEASGDRQ